MFSGEVYQLKKSGRECYLLPWGSDKIPCPWKSGYARVIIPLTEAEKVNSQKKCHMQVVKIDNLVRSQQNRFH